MVHTSLYDRQIYMSKYKNLHTGCARFEAILLIIKYSNEQSKKKILFFKNKNSDML